MTHKRGNHLDQVFTNLQVTKTDLAYTDIIDHAIIRCSLTLNMRENDVDIRSMPSRIAMSEIRKERHLGIDGKPHGPKLVYDTSRSTDSL